MSLVYSPRAVRDIGEIGDYYHAVATPAVAAAFGERLAQIIDRIASRPYSAPHVVNRSGVRAVLVLPYPYKIFYRVRGDAVEILHIRHTARRPWE